MFRISLILIVFIIQLTGCKKNMDSTFTCTVPNYDPCALKAPATEIQAIKDYLASKSITATEHCSGVFYIIDAPGSGVTPNLCSEVTVTYEGKLTNDNVFDSNNTGATFLLGQLINGWKATLPLIKAGGSIRLFIPPSLGYGSAGYGPVPPNAILIFRVDLVTVRN